MGRGRVDGVLGVWGGDVRERVRWGAHACVVKVVFFLSGVGSGVVDLIRCRTVWTEEKSVALTTTGAGWKEARRAMSRGGGRGTGLVGGFVV